RHRNRQQLAVLARNRAVAADDLVEAEPRVEIRGRELLHFLHQSEVCCVVVVFAHSQRRYTMQPCFEYRKFSPEPVDAMIALEKYIAGCGLDRRFIHLLKLRASQINGCAFCIDMHSIDARAAGESEQRLYALDAW